MNLFNPSTSNLKSHATQQVEEAIARYRSVENKRIALRRALADRPDDTRLRSVLAQLISPQQIQRAAASGIFINYSRSDELFALELAVSLRRVNITCWLDMVQVKGNGDWHTDINTALFHCGLMIAVMSPEAMADSEARAEQVKFLDMGKLILPVLKLPCDVSDLGFWLSPVDFSKDFNQGVNNLLNTLTPSEDLLRV